MRKSGMLKSAATFAGIAFLAICVFPAGAPFQEHVLTAALYLVCVVTGLSGVFVFLVLTQPAFAIVVCMAVGFQDVAKRIVFRHSSRNRERVGFADSIKGFLRFAGRFYVFMFCSGMTLAGMYVMPHAAAALIPLFACGLLMLRNRFPVESGRLKIRLAVVATALALAIVASHVEVHAGAFAPVRWLLAVVGIVGIVVLLRRESAVDGNVYRWVFMSAAMTGFCVCAAYLLSIPPDGRMDAGRVRRISGATNIYDLRTDPVAGRLFFTSKKRPFFGWIDLKSGASHRTAYRFESPRRIAVFPGTDRVFVGGGGGAVEFAVDPINFERVAVKGTNVDVESYLDKTLLIARESDWFLTKYDLKTGKTSKIRLPGFFVWPYGIEVDARRGVAYISNWILSPYVHRVDMKAGKARKARKAYNGPMNMDLCAAPSRNALYVARLLHHRVDVLDARTLRKRGEIPTGFGAREIECDDAHGRLFALTQFDGAVHFIDMDSGREFDSARVGRSGRALTYDAAHNRLFAGTRAGIFEVDLRGGKDGY